MSAARSGAAGRVADRLGDVARRWGIALAPGEADGLVGLVERVEAALARRPDPGRVRPARRGRARAAETAGDAGDAGAEARRPAAVASRPGRGCGGRQRLGVAYGRRRAAGDRGRGPAGRLAGRREGPGGGGRPPHPLRLGRHLGCRRRSGRRPGRGRAASGRRPRRRGHEAARVRVRHHRDQPGLRDAAEPGRAGPGAGGIVVGIGGGGGGRGGRPGGGDRYRRIGAHPRCALRGDRLQAVAGGAADRRRRRPVAHARPRRVPGR